MILAAGVVRRELVATDNGSTLTYIEGESDNTTWQGMYVYVLR